MRSRGLDFLALAMGQPWCPLAWTDTRLKPQRKCIRGDLKGPQLRGSPGLVAQPKLLSFAPNVFHRARTAQMLCSVFDRAAAPQSRCEVLNVHLGPGRLTTQRDRFFDNDFSEASLDSNSDSRIRALALY